MRERSREKKHGEEVQEKEVHARCSYSLGITEVLRQVKLQKYEERGRLLTHIFSLPKYSTCIFGIGKHVDFHIQFL